jgi:NADPH:quinone reductase-like Zn-dependent oxidoreductase
MKAMAYTQYGSPDVLQLAEVAQPVPKDDEVLVNIHAASVNYNTLAMVTGSPFMVRLMMGGIAKPKFTIPGNDMAGTVAAVGAKVTRFRVGDAVFGDSVEHGFGALAEYAVVPEKALTLKPANLSYEEAAAVPEAAIVALQGLREAAQIQPGNQVLIVGATGGIGSFAVQLAKYFGAEVTAVCSSRNIEMVRGLGADHVIDYTQTDFARTGQQYDVILATMGYRPIGDYIRALRPKGRYIATGGSLKQIFQALLLGSFITLFTGKKATSLIMKPNQGLDLLRELLETGTIRPVIDRCYPLSEAPAALRYYGEGRSRGKIIISVPHTA